MASLVADEKPHLREESLRGPTVEEIIADLEKDSVIPADAVDITYARKAAVLNRAIKDIGMGWYQWQLFIVIGFGWASDNLWPVVTSLILVSPFGVMIYTHLLSRIVYTARILLTRVHRLLSRPSFILPSRRY